jgi:tetratricopeptide (TPR) repeat protein
MSDSILNQINKCREKLRQLKEAYDSSGKKKRYAREKVSNGLKVTVRYHPYELNPCLNEKDIAKFEKKCGIVLPAEFRLSLLHLGNGGGLFWKELVPANFDKGDFYYTDSIILNREWPCNTILKIKGKNFKVYSVNTDDEEEDVLLADSFLNWLESELDGHIAKSPAFFNEEEPDSSYAGKQEHNDNETEKEAEQKIEKLMDQFSAIYLYDNKKKEVVISQVKELVAHQLLSEEQYVSLMDKAFTSHVHELQALIGEQALEHHQKNRITLSDKQQIELMELTGLGYMNLKDTRAIGLLEKSIEMSNNTFHFANIANTLLQLNRLEEARLYINKAPVTFYTTHIKGCIYSAMGDTGTAITCFQDGIQLHNTYSSNYEGLGDIYADRNQYEEAITSYKNAINKCRDSRTVIYYKLAKTYALANKTKDCVKVLDNLLKMGPADCLSTIEHEPAFEVIVKSTEYNKLKGRNKQK